MRKIVALPIAIAVGFAGLTGCGSSHESRACVDRYTNIRYDDAYCHDHRANYSYMYYPVGYHVPRVGQQAYGGHWKNSKTTVKPPKSAKVAPVVPGAKPTPNTGAHVAPKPPKKTLKQRLTKPKSHSSSRSGSSRSGGRH